MSQRMRVGPPINLIYTQQFQVWTWLAIYEANKSMVYLIWCSWTQASTTPSPFRLPAFIFLLTDKKLVLPTHHHSLGNDVMLMLVKINEYGNFHIIDYLIMVTMKNLIIALCVCGALANKFIDQTVDCKSHLNRR